ncbi:PIN domain-containing protein [Acidobacteriota bacterium]
MTVFIDTNVFLYAHDLDAGPKHDIASDILQACWMERNGVISTQVLQEFYVNVTRKISRPLSRKSARDIISAYSVWPIATIDHADILRASSIETRYHLSFWDSLIVVSANRLGASDLLTEDLNPGQVIDGVRIVNPFE